MHDYYNTVYIIIQYSSCHWDSTLSYVTPLYHIYHYRVHISTSRLRINTLSISQIHHKVDKKTVQFTVLFSPNFVFVHLSFLFINLYWSASELTCRCVFCAVPEVRLDSVTLEARLLTRQSHPTENLWSVQFCDQRYIL